MLHMQSTPLQSMSVLNAEIAAMGPRHALKLIKLKVLMPHNPETWSLCLHQTGLSHKYHPYQHASLHHGFWVGLSNPTCSFTPPQAKQSSFASCTIWHSPTNPHYLMLSSESWSISHAIQLISHCLHSHILPFPELTSCSSWHNLLKPIEPSLPILYSSPHLSFV